jgi:hypothetical protein
MATVCELKAKAKEMGLKGYSKLKKAELEKLVMDGKAPASPVKAVSPVKAKPASPVKKAPTPVKAVSALKVGGKNVLVNSKFWTRGEWINKRPWLGDTTDFKMGTKTQGALIPEPIAIPATALYFWKDIKPTPLELETDGLKNYFDPLKVNVLGGNVRKLSEAQAKSILKNGRFPRMEQMHQAIGAYLNAPKELKDAYPFAGVYEGTAVKDAYGPFWQGGVADFQDSSKYGVIFPFVESKVSRIGSNIYKKKGQGPTVQYSLDAIKYQFKTTGKILQRRN